MGEAGSMSTLDSFYPAITKRCQLLIALYSKYLIFLTTNKELIYQQHFLWMQNPKAINLF